MPAVNGTSVITSQIVSGNALLEMGDLIRGACRNDVTAPMICAKSQIDEIVRLPFFNTPAIIVTMSSS